MLVASLKSRSTAFEVKENHERNSDASFVNHARGNRTEREMDLTAGVRKRNDVVWCLHQGKKKGEMKMKGTAGVAFKIHRERRDRGGKRGVSYTVKKGWGGRADDS